MRRTRSHDTEQHDACNCKKMKLSPQEAQDVGLGLGVDGSLHSPWDSSEGGYQARTIDHHGDIKTLDGGGAESILKEVTSTTDVSVDLKAPIPVGSAATVGLDSDFSFSHTKSKMIVGKRIRDLKVSFNDAMDEDVDTPREGFEKNLYKFIAKQMTSERKAPENAIQMVDKLLAKRNGGNHSQIAKLCIEFIENKKVTHYAHSLLLGASAYLVMTTKTYKTQFGAGVSADFAGFVSARGGLHVGHTRSTAVTKLRELPEGAFTYEGKMIKRNPDKQAVINATLKPISTLIENDTLKKMVEEASAKYITENSLNLDGYCIMCTANYQELFFKVNECPCPTLEVATKENEASVFHIVKHNKNWFRLVYKKKSKLRSPKEYQLTVPLTDGYNTGPLESKDNKFTRLAVLSSSWVQSLFQSFRAEPLTEWIKGQQDFYINCKYGYFTDSFLCIKRHPSKTGYQVCCTPSIADHEKKGSSMLFKLVKPYELKRK